MWIRKRVLPALLCALSSACGAPFAAGDTTVAITATVHSGAAEERTTFVDGLLDLLQAEVSTTPNVSVVERRSIDKVLLELALSKDLATNADSRLRLGKIINADLILTLELQPAKTDDRALRIIVRIVESLTGIIRGVSIAEADDAQIEEAASQISRYFNLVLSKSSTPAVTIAVAPFECEGRFERLRPLELGLRDITTARLIRWNDHLHSGGAEAEDAEQTPRRFHVVQRTNMKQLLEELDLIRSALIDRDRLPANLPSRAAAFLVRGQVNETNEGGEFRIIVSAQLVNAATNRSVKDFRLVAKPDELEQQLAREVDLFAMHLSGSGRDLKSFSAAAREEHETSSLFESTLADLRRFRRICPINGHSRDFAIKGQHSGPVMVKAESPLGASMLQKAIDRLETILFIQPNNYEAAYALAFAMSFNTTGQQHTRRPEDLLKKVSSGTDDDYLKSEALQLLAELSWHYRTEQIDSKNTAAAARRIAFAFVNMPVKYRGYEWVQTSGLFKDVVDSCDDEKVLMDVIDFCVKGAMDKSYSKRRFLISLSHNVAATLRERSPNAKIPELPVLEEMPLSEASEALKNKDYKRAGEIYVQRATGGSVEELPRDHSLNFSPQLVSAVKYFRYSRRFDLVRSVFDSMKSPHPSSSSKGSYLFEKGLCLASESRKDEAIDVLMTAAEDCRHFVDNSDVEEQIEKLGGPKLRENRDVDVTYVSRLSGRPTMVRSLAHDGEELFAAGGGIGEGICAYNLKTGQWSKLTPGFGRVSDLAAKNGLLWVATEKEGLWKCDLASGDWTSFTQETGFPDNRISTILTTDHGTWVGVGVSGAGGLVLIDNIDQVTVMEGVNSPTNMPKHLAATDNDIIVATTSSLHVFSGEDQTWTAEETPGLKSVGVFSGRDHAWVSGYGKELTPFGASEMEAREFRPTWFPPGLGSAGYRLSFVIDRGDNVWFGGTPWRRYGSVGFYRFNRKTLEFRMYNLRDGFKRSTVYTTYDGLSAGNDIWLATSAGLARVTPREKTRPLETSASRRHELFLKTTFRQEIKQQANWEVLRCKPIPTLEFSQAAPNRFLDGELYLLTNRYGEAEAFTSVSLRHQGHLFAEVASLSSDSLRGDLEKFGPWKPRRGGSGAHVASTQPAVPKTGDGELAAITKIVRSIEVSVKTNRWRTSRLHNVAIHRYRTDFRATQIGAVFMYGNTNDPDALLKVWYSRKDEKWYWLAAAATSLPLRCSEQGEVVWEKPGYWSAKRGPESPYVEVVIGKYPQLLD